MRTIPYVSNGDRESDLWSMMLDQRTVFIVGEINDELATSVVAELLYLQAKNPKGEINLYINSPGGSVTAGLAIYDTMRHISCPVHTLCLGQACSMAAVLLAAGDKRSLLPSSRVMIHQPSGGAEGKESDIVISAKEITRIRTKLVEILAKHTGKSLKQVDKDTERDYFMTPEEALRYGMADHITETMKKEF